jgi:beta-lactamase regulating signal transducer with metallopeptidase domain/protocatechuate 3,4-dioxygenase beta subunit
VVSIEHRRAKAMGDPWRILGDLGADGTVIGLACAAKATGVLAGTGLVALAMRRTAAATRHLVWGLGLAGALAVLPLALALPRWGVPVLEAPARAEPAMASSPDSEAPPPEVSAVMEMPLVRNEAVATPAGVAPAGPNVSEAPRVAWPLVVWVAGTLAVLAWGVTGWASTWWMGRKAERVTDPTWVEAAREAAERLGTRRGVRLLRGAPAAMPLTWGVLRPTLLLPGEADEWPDERRRAVLLHELAHVRRRDCLTHWLGLTACAAYWFNPLAWWAASRLRAEREQACDDLVLEAGERPSDYAAQLLGVARSLRPARALAPAAMAMARPSGLETRLLAILDARRNRRGPARWLVVACLAAVLTVSAALAAVRLVAKELPRPVVSGQVVGPDGKPHGGAEVVVVASRFRWRYRDSDKPAAELLGRGRCDEQGRFRIELAGEPASDEGRVILVATARDHGFAARELTDLNATIDGPIRQPAEQPVEVRLVDLEGSPIAGAEVRPVSVYPAGGGTGLDADLLSHGILPPLAQKWTSDRDGRFAVRGYGPDHSAFLDVRAPGFGKQRLRLAIKAGVGTSTLTLGRAHVVEGRVTLGKGGPPAVGARVEARTMSDKHGIGMYLGDAEVTTDQDGHYRIDAAPGASIVLKVFPPREGADAYLMRGDLVVPGDSVASRVDFALPKGVLVRGRVTEAGTGRPVAGAVVHHQAHERNNPYFIKGNPGVFNPDEQRVVTAADGTFRLGIMPGPGYLLVKGPTADYLHEEVSSVELAGHLHWPNTRTYPDAQRKLSPKPDEGPVDVEFTLRRGVTVRGRLVDQDGQPVREALLVSRWYLSRNGMTVNHAPTWKALRGGRLELDGCDPGSSAPVLFLDAKNQRGAAVELSGKQAGEDVTVTMRPCGSARVRIVNGQGKPVRAGRSPAHLEIVLSPGASWGDIHPGNQMTSPLLSDAIHASNLDVDRYRDIKTDADGRMTFPTLIPGATYRIIVFNQKEKTEIEFTVGPGEAKDLGDLKIRELEHAG